MQTAAGQGFATGYDSRRCVANWGRIALLRKEGYGYLHGERAGDCSVERFDGAREPCHEGCRHNLGRVSGRSGQASCFDATVGVFARADSDAPAMHAKRKGAVKRQCNRAGRLFRLGARSLARTVNKALGGFFRRLKKTKGGLVATKAVARKMALLYYRTLKHGLAYVEKGLKEYEMQYEESQRRLLAKLAAKQGFKLMSIEAEKLQAVFQTARHQAPS